MAFVCKSERVLKFKPNFVQSKTYDEFSNSNIGPGSYIGPMDYQPKQSNAPFQSSQIREVGAIINQRNPGPGEYKPSVGFDQLNNQSNVSLSSILQRLSKNKPGFNSNTKRFDITQNGNKVGPGQYDSHNQTWVKSHKNINQLRSKTQLRGSSQALNNPVIEKHHSPPSIPYGDFKYGYKVKDDGHHVVSLKTLEKELQTETSKYPLGPGAYENVDGLPKYRGGVVSYAQDTSRRTKIELNPVSKIIGPGSYELDKPTHIPLYKLNPNSQSSMFASQTKRQASHDPLSSRKKNASKMRIQLRRLTNDISRNTHEFGESRTQNSILEQDRAYQSQTYNDSIQEEYDPDEDNDKICDKITPGPGQYIGQELQSSFKQIYKPPQYQFFGSCAERFNEKRNIDAVLKSKLGPGVYQTEQTNKTQRLSFKTVGFSSEIDRFYVRDKGVPGVGFYKNALSDLQLLKEKHSHNKFQQSFGSQERRFVAKTNGVPGPGEYKPERSIVALDNKRNEIQPESAAFLNSQSGRQISNPVLQHSPPVGSYNPPQTIGTGISPRKDSKENSPRKSKILTLQPTQKTLSKSVTPEKYRFEHQLQKDKLSPIRGPGYYDAYDQNQISQKQGQFNYFTLTKRFEHGSYIDKSKQKLPGPGYYRGQDEDSLTIKNKSFNLMFN